jgi:hypothetical protein
MLRARRAYVSNGGDREPSPGLCSEPFERAPRPTRCVGGPGYNTVTEPRRDDFPNNFVGDLVPTDPGWVVVPPACCPAGHEYGDGGWSVSSVWCTCNGRHMAWRCHCGAVLYAPQSGPHCRIRDRGPVSMHEIRHRRRRFGAPW